MENWAGGFEKIRTGNTWPLACLGSMSSLPKTKKRQSLYIQETNGNDNGRNTHGIDRQKTCLVDKQKSIIRLKCTNTDEQLPLMNEESISTIQNIRNPHNNLKSESSCESIAGGSKEVDTYVINKPQKSYKNINSVELKPIENLANDQYSNDTKVLIENNSLRTVVDNSCQCSTETQESVDHSFDNKSNCSKGNIKHRARNFFVATLLLIIFLVISLAVWSAFVYLQPSSGKPHAAEKNADKCYPFSYI